MQPFDTWQNDPEFQKLDLTSKAKVFLTYFDRSMADDEFRALPSERQRSIKTNFLHSYGVDLGVGKGEASKEPEQPIDISKEGTFLYALGENAAQVATGIPLTAAGTVLGAIGGIERESQLTPEQQAQKDLLAFETNQIPTEAKGATFNPQKALEILGQTAALGYEPKTEAGKRLSKTLSLPFVGWEKIGEVVGGELEEAGYPMLGAMAHTVAAAIPFLAPFSPKIERAIKQNIVQHKVWKNLPPEKRVPVIVELTDMLKNPHWAKFSEAKLMRYFGKNSKYFAQGIEKWVRGESPSPFATIKEEIAKAAEAAGPVAGELAEKSTIPDWIPGTGEIKHPYPGLAQPVVAASTLGEKAQVKTPEELGAQKGELPVEPIQAERLRPDQLATVQGKQVVPPVETPKPEIEPSPIPLIKRGTEPLKAEIPRALEWLGAPRPEPTVKLTPPEAQAQQPLPIPKEAAPIPEVPLPIPEVKVEEPAVPTTPEAPKGETPTPQAKEPWEMTREEFINAGPEGYSSIGNYGWSKTGGDHSIAVKDALSEGKPVPAEVLADYPELRGEGKTVEQLFQERKARKSAYAKKSTAANNITLEEWVKRHGGLRDDKFSDVGREMNRMSPGIVNLKKGTSLSEMAEHFRNETGMEIDPEDLGEIILSELKKPREKRTTMGLFKGEWDVDKWAEKELELELERRYGTTDTDEIDKQRASEEVSRLEVEEQGNREIIEAAEQLKDRPLTAEEEDYLASLTKEESGLLFSVEPEEFALAPSESTPQEQAALRESILGEKRTTLPADIVESINFLRTKGRMQDTSPIENIPSGVLEPTWATRKEIKNIDDAIGTGEVTAVQIPDDVIDWFYNYTYAQDRASKKRLDSLFTKTGERIRKIEIPQEKIQPATTGKQGSLLGPQKGETLDIFERGKPPTEMGDVVTAPIFYSQMQKVLEKKLPNSSSPETLKTLVSGWAQKGEFKADELKWSGLDEFLAGKTGKVTKQEVLDYLKANQVEIREVTKGVYPNRYEEFVTKMEAKYGEGYSSESLTVAEREEQGHLWTLTQQRGGMREGDTKFSQWQLPGGEPGSYRELLLTLPMKAKPESLKPFSEWAKERGFSETQIQEEWNNPAELFEEYRAWEDKRVADFSKQYRSSHWSEPNVLAHVRMNDRVDAEGKRVLFLEEVQSDWHQAGRKKGYGNVAFDKAKRDELQSKWEEFVDQHKSETPEAQAVLRECQAENNKQWESRVPPAPFSKTWHELVLKRMLRYAAENGYDKLVWTTGEQQAERYDLSKQVDSVSGNKNKDGTYSLQVYKDNRILHGESNIAESKLADLLGKDLAEKIIKKGNAPWEFSGLDLKVGGEGMKGFYDKIIPDYLNKYGKKWGAKVGETEITSPPINPIRRYGAQENNGLYGIFDLENDNFVEGTTFYKTYQEASKRAEEMNGIKSTMSVHSLPITPAMKESVLGEGQAMFDINTSLPSKSITPERFQEAVQIVGRVLKYRLPESVHGDIGLQVKEVIEPNAKAFIRSLQEHGYDVDQESIAEFLEKHKRDVKGLTSFFGNVKAVVQVALRDKAGMEESATHESVHVTMEWLLPEKRYDQMMKFFDNNREDAVKDYLKWEKEGKASARPTWLQEIYRYLKNLFDRVRNALNGKGFVTPQDIFQEIAEKKYTEKQPKEVIEKRIGGMREKALFKGEKAKGIAHLDEAKALESQGVPMEEIRQRTGWFRAPWGEGEKSSRLASIRERQKELGISIDKLSERRDAGTLDRSSSNSLKRMQNEYWRLEKEATSQYLGKWRFEIDDSGATLKRLPVEGEYTVLKDIFNHPELYKSYPEFRNLKISVDDTGNFIGEFSHKSWGGEPVIKFNLKALKKEGKDAKKTLIHEIQHAIQEEHEGFARGGNVNLAQSMKDEFDRKWGFLKENSSVKKWMVEQDKILDDSTLSIDEAYKKLEDHSKNAPSILQDAWNKGKKLKGRPENIYLKLAGEYESRKAAERAKLTAEERKAQPPYATGEVIAPEDLIVRMEKPEVAALQWLGKRKKKR